MSTNQHYSDGMVVSAAEGKIMSELSEEQRVMIVNVFNACRNHWKNTEMELANHLIIYTKFFPDITEKELIGIVARLSYRT